MAFSVNKAGIGHSQKSKRVRESFLPRAFVRGTADIKDVYENALLFARCVKEMLLSETMETNFKFGNCNAHTHVARKGVSIWLMF